jgi:uncharacterized protein (TIGR03089 family)
VHQLTPEQRFADLLARDPSRPFVTYYDEATGERSELSVKSLANWVAKTHHLLGDELGLGAGDSALVVLPPHWISVPILLGCLTAGLALSVDGDAEVAFVTPSSRAAAGTIPDVYAIAPAAAAVGLRDAVPAGAEDYVGAVRPQADAWGGVRFGATAASPCWDGLSRADMDALAVARAAQVGLRAGGRLLTTHDWAEPVDWVDAVLAPLAVGGSVVIVRNGSDETVLERRMSQERATARLT